MTEVVTQVVVAAAALVVILVIVQTARRAQFRFIIRIDKGEPRVSKGKVPPEFLDALRAICQEVGVTAGWIGGTARGKAIMLRFSRHFPPNVQQRIRNAWFSP